MSNRTAYFAPAPRQALTGLLIVGLLFGALMPASLKHSAHALLGLQLPWPSIGHFVLFLLIAMVGPYGTGLAAEKRAILLALALAIGTEVLQHWVPGRHPMLRDVGIDLAGTATGRVLVLVWGSWWGGRGRWRRRAQTLRGR